MNRTVKWIVTLAVVFSIVFTWGSIDLWAADSIQVITVPADTNDLEKPHLSYNGHLTTYKAILRGLETNASCYYRWDIDGDGLWDQLSGQTYAAAEGRWYQGTANDLSGKAILPDNNTDTVQLKTATIEVATGLVNGIPSNSRYGSYKILQYGNISPEQANQASPEQLSILKEIALDDALWYLHQLFVQDNSAANAIGYTGYITGGSNNITNTALFILAMADNGHYAAYPAGCNLFNIEALNIRNDALYGVDPYADDLYRAVNYLLKSLIVMPVAADDIGDDGSNLRIDKSGVLTGLYIPNTNPEDNCSSLALAALAKSKLAGSSVAAASGVVNGVPFEVVVQRMVDAGVAAQIDENSFADALGGWTYTPVNAGQVITAGNVNPIISGGWLFALHTAEEEMGTSGVYINNRLKERMANNLVYAQNADGGCKYANQETFAPIGNYLMACKWLGWDQWEAANGDIAGYPYLTITKGEARQIYDKYLQYVIAHWENSSDSISFGGYLWTNGNYDGAVYSNSNSGTSRSNLHTKSLFGISIFADTVMTSPFGTHDWKREFAVSLVKGQHSSGRYAEEDSSYDQYYLGFTGVTAYAAMSGAGLYNYELPEMAIATSGLSEATVGSEYVAALTATGGTQQYTWQIAGLPDEFHYDNMTGAISGTPVSAGTYPLSITVNDGISTCETTINLIIYSGVLTINTGSSLDCIAGASNNIVMTASGGLAPYTWSTTELPLGLSLDAANGVISGIPIVTGEYSLVLNVTDNNAKSAEKNITMTIRANKPVLIKSDRLPDAYLSVDYSTVMEAEGGQAPYTWSASGLPNGLSMNPSTGVISGTPENEGIYTVSITITDYLGISLETQIEQTVCTVKITTPQLPDAKWGVQYYTAMEAQGGQPPYTWTLLNGNLPSGFSLDAETGAISGNIPLGTGYGNFNLLVKATDAGGKYDEKQFNLWVDPDVIVPRIMTESLPVGKINEYYSVTMEETSGLQSYIWSADILPAGLNINESSGLISGTPTTAGLTNIRITAAVANDEQVYSSKQYSLYVLEPYVIDTTDLPKGDYDKGYCYTLTASGGMIPWKNACTWSATGLPPGLNINKETGVIYGIPQASGTYNVFLCAIDSAGNRADMEKQLIINEITDECFIATAAFGSKFTWPVALLRYFRDQYLLTNPLGTSFVNFYYQNSPPIAAIIASSQPLKTLARVLLAPVIAGVYLIYHPGIIAAALLLLIALFAVHRSRLLRRQV